jgi:hypothetical protein
MSTFTHDQISTHDQIIASAARQGRTATIVSCIEHADGTVTTEYRLAGPAEQVLDVLDGPAGG